MVINDNFSSFFKINKERINRNTEITQFNYNKAEIGTGKGVRIAIIDSGCPKHVDIDISGECVNFCDDNSDFIDYYGHSTIVSGIIGANNKKGLVGVAPNSILSFAKVINNNGECSFNALVGAVLWAVVKKVDIIVMALGTEYDYKILHDAIKKAKQKNICIFSSAGSSIKHKILYPSLYEETFSVGSLTSNLSTNNTIKEISDFYIKNRGLFTTYLNNTYIKAYGSSVATAYFAGRAALLIEQYRNSISEKDMPVFIYSKLVGNETKKNNKKRE